MHSEAVVVKPGSGDLRGHTRALALRAHNPSTKHKAC